MNEPKYTISTAARIAGISVHTLRKYEREGLIIPFKKDSNQRLYSDQDLDRIRCIIKTICKSYIWLLLQSLAGNWYGLRFLPDLHNNARYQNPTS